MVQFHSASCGSVRSGLNFLVFPGLQTRLDALTEVDDCGKLTIRCSQDYFSLDCGITAFELSDYSPGEEPQSRAAEEGGQEPDRTPRSNQEAGPEESRPPCVSNQELQDSLPEQTAPGDPANLSPRPSQNESTKRPLQGVSRHSSAEASPTQPSLPKKAALFWDGGSREEGKVRQVNLLSGLQHQAELSRSTPSLMDPPDRTKFWLELDSVYPEHVSQSCESLQVGRRPHPQFPSNLEGGQIIIIDFI